jgi:dTDP-4-amino-4,6-dideoxygalactose transaminase
LEEFIPYLEDIWQRGILTNGGPYHQALEKALCDYLSVPFISLFTNGTIALITALQALGIKGEVITTPYSFVATSHALLWNGITPVFIDIDPVTLNLDPAKIAAKITPQTSAILPVHCYGNPCAVDEIEELAHKHGLKVIYDAAHAFGVECHCGSLLNHGDVSVLSFHATKVFNTLEGGAIVCHDLAMKQHIDQLKNFGFVDEVTVTTAGINGKMSEVNAAFGLLQLKNLAPAIERRRLIDIRYRHNLQNVTGITCLTESTALRKNYSYFPILIDASFPLTRDEVYEKLKESGIFTRRYFYPLITQFPMYAHLASAQPDNLPIATAIANQILCLPIYSDLTVEEQDIVINALLTAT